MKLEYTSQIVRGWPKQGARERTELLAPSVLVSNGDWVEMQADGTIAKTSLTNTRRAGLVVRGTGDSTSNASLAGQAMTPQPAKSVTAISAWAGGYMTVTVTAHGYSTGDVVTIASVTTTAVNGSYQIQSITDTNNFVIYLATTPGAITLGSPTATRTYGFITGGKAVVLWGNFVVATSNYDTAPTYAPSSPLTVSNGKLTLANGVAGTSIASTSITQAAGVATYTTATDHGFSAGQVVTVSGATAAGYNVTTTILSVPTTTTFTYAVASGTASPATVQGAAVTAKDPEVGFVTKVQGVTTTETAQIVAVIY